MQNHFCCEVQRPLFFLLCKILKFLFWYLIQLDLFKVILLTWSHPALDLVLTCTWLEAVLEASWTEVVWPAATSDS